MSNLKFISDKLIQFRSCIGKIDDKAICILLKQFQKEIFRLEKHTQRDEILKELYPLREAVRQSPFLQRAQDWPRGYQGDFETIEYILEAKNRAGENTLGYVVEDFFIHSDICKQHINKVAYQSQLIREAVCENQSPEIISIGCGTSEDIRISKDIIRSSSAKITLVDVDKDALAYSTSQLADIEDRIVSMHGNIYKIMRQLTTPYHLILIGGVFDYLNDKTIISILSSLKNNLAESGKIFFTNINVGNPYRVFMEYLSNWNLCERSAEDLMQLVLKAGWPEEAVRMQMEDTRLTHLVELRRA